MEKRIIYITLFLAIMLLGLSAYKNFFVPMGIYLPPDPIMPMLITGHAIDYLPSWATENPQQFYVTMFGPTELGLIVGNADYVYRTGYVYTKYGKVPFDLEGNLVPDSNWIRTNATKILYIYPEDFEFGENYVVTYACVRVQDGFDCNENKWMLARFNVTEEGLFVAVPPSELCEQTNGTWITCELEYPDLAITDFKYEISPAVDSINISGVVRNVGDIAASGNATIRISQKADGGQQNIQTGPILGPGESFNFSASLGLFSGANNVSTSVEITDTESDIRNNVVAYTFEIFEGAVVCVDSDGGENPNLKARCEDTTGTYYDQCATSNTVLEYRCENFVCVANETNCTGLEGCENGACKLPECMQENQIVNVTPVTININPFGMLAHATPPFSALNFDGLGIFNAEIPCCSGLIARPNVSEFKSDCSPKYKPLDENTPIPGMCIRCGDGVCGTGESKCNCPIDCLIPDGAECLDSDRISWIAHPLAKDYPKFAADYPKVSEIMFKGVTKGTYETGAETHFTVGIDEINPAPFANQKNYSEYYDYCKDSKILREAYCNGSLIAYRDVTCEDRCERGRCIKIEEGVCVPHCECPEGQVFSIREGCLVAPEADLTATIQISNVSDMSITNPVFEVGSSLYVNVTIKNIGLGKAEHRAEPGKEIKYSVSFPGEGQAIGEFYSLEPDEEMYVSESFYLADPGKKTLVVDVDALDNVGEVNETNNIASVTVYVFEAEQLCADTDNYDPNILGAAYDRTGAVLADLCHNETTLNESVCKEGLAGYAQVDCPGGCQNGVCVEEVEEELICTDTDGGIEYDIQGIVTRNGEEFADYCEIGVLTEYYCKEDGIVGSEDYICPAGCQDGVCIEEVEEVECPFKGIPECRFVGSKSEGWYYSETEEFLRSELCGAITTTTTTIVPEETTTTTLPYLVAPASNPCDLCGTFCSENECWDIGGGSEGYCDYQGIWFIGTCSLKPGYVYG